MKKNIKTITTKAVIREINAMEEYLEARREKAAAYRKAKREAAALEARRAKARLYRWKRAVRMSFPPSKMPKNISLVMNNAKKNIIKGIRQGKIAAPKGAIKTIKAA